MAARGEAQADVEVSTLVVPAWRLRWRAPELALVLGERAVALASTRRDEVDRLRAEALVVFASNRMGRGVRIADRALDALKAAEAASERETAWRLRVELADSARSVGAPLTGFAAVRPVLEADDVPPGLRATALVQASECLVSVGRGPALAQALDEADHLYQADPLLDHDTTLLHRGLLRASAAGQHRRWGDLQAAVAAARDGLAVLDRLKEPESDNGQVRGRLTVELVCALMDLNKPGEASEIGTPLLERPVRAPSASTAGWLRLALATRVHLPAGRVDQARDLLRDAADSAERHQLDTLLAESLLALAHVHEVAGDLAEALANLRSAHAAERRRARAVYAVRARLAAEFAGVHRRPEGGLHDELAALLRTGTPAAAPPTDPDLSPEVKQQLRQWRPVQMHRNEGVRVKRSRRAAEDMTVEGISAARAHAADRWRLVQPFGETEGDPQPGGRRRAPEPGTRPTQGRPEHARSVQARPNPPTTPDAPTTPTPDLAPQGPAHASNATADTPEPAAPTAAHTAGAGTSGPGVAEAGTRSSGTSAGSHARGAGSDDATSGGAAPGDTSAGGRTGAGPGEAVSGGVVLGGGFGGTSAGRPVDGGTGGAGTGGAGSGGVGPGGDVTGGSRRGAVVPSGGQAGGVRQGSAVSGGHAGAVSRDSAASAGADVAGAALGGSSEVGAASAGGPVGGAGVGGGRQEAVAEAGGQGGGRSGESEAGPGQHGAGAPGVGATGVRRPIGGAGFGGGGFGIVQRDVGAPGEEAATEGASPAVANEGGERSVPAAGLIAAAGAVRSGRRRAAREAAEEEGERSSGDPGSDSSVLDTLKAAGLLDPQRAGGRRRAPDADEEPTVPEPVQHAAPEPESVPEPESTSEPMPEPKPEPTSEPNPEPRSGPEPVQWRVESPPRLRGEAPPPPVDMFDSPTMVQPAARDDVPPVGLGAAFVKGPVIPTARVPEPPDYPLPPAPEFGLPEPEPEPEPAAKSEPEPAAKSEIEPEPEPAAEIEAAVESGAGAVSSVMPEQGGAEVGPQASPAVEARPVFPSTDVDAPAEDRSTPVPQPEPDQVPDVAEPDQVPPVPVPEPVPAEPSPEPTPPSARFSPTGFLGAADVEHDDTPVTGREPAAAPEAAEGEESTKEPFVTAVVVGGKTIDLPAIVVEPTPPAPDSPSATRASRRHKSDLSLAELLAEALVAYEDARREDEAAARAEVDEDTVPISPVGNPPPASENETTVPIQRVDPPRRFDTWTLPES